MQIKLVYVEPYGTIIEQSVDCESNFIDNNFLVIEVNKNKIIMLPKDTVKNVEIITDVDD